MADLSLTFADLQSMNLSEELIPLNPLDLGLGYARLLPDLSNLVHLTTLTLAENMLLQVPNAISKLTNLRFLDLSCNDDLKARLSIPAIPVGYLLGHIQTLD